MLSTISVDASGHPLSPSLATLFSHAWVGTLLGSAGPGEIPLWRRLALPASLAVVPDLDVIAFSLGIPYSHPLGHRGITHSLLFAVLLAPVAVRVFLPNLPLFARSWWVMVVLSTLACASHGLLDAMTDAGRGVGFFLPFDVERYFFEFRPIRTSPIGVSNFLERGGPILLNELRWVFLPSLAIWGAAALIWRSFRRL